MQAHIQLVSVWGSYILGGGVGNLPLNSCCGFGEQQNFSSFQWNDLWQCTVGALLGVYHVYLYLRE